MITRTEFDLLPSDRKIPCPDCGLSITIPFPGCSCPPNPKGYGTLHINLYHHNCEQAWHHAYPPTKNVGHGE